MPIAPATINRITDIMKEDIEKWHNRPLHKRYSVLYFLDGLHVKLRRDTVDKEIVYVVLVINEEGYREILDFFMGGQESAYGWQEILQHLYKRGVQEVLLGVLEVFWDWREPLRPFIGKLMCSVVLFTK